MKWSDPQLQAINAKEGRFLVSAGAGSGKTAVLSERIRRLVEESGVSLSQLLVLTFTNKAAHEMKGRVRDLFIKDGHSELAEQVEASAITTFDAFALSLVKKYHFDLHVAPDLAIMDEGFLKIEERKILDEILLERYEEKDPLFLDFVKHYALKDDETIVAMTLKVLDTAILSGDKAAFFQRSLDYYFDEKRLHEEIIPRFVYLENRDLRTAYEAAKHYENGELAEAETAFLEPFLSLQDYDALYQAILGQKYPRLPSGKNANVDPLDKALHSSLSKLFNATRDAIANFGDEKEELSRLFRCKPYAKIFLGLAEELDARMDAYKKEKGVYSFADIAELARQAALSPSIGASLKRQYSYVMVDEFQDTSDLQASFLQALDSGNFFAVGDVKQSIYRFRNANPAIFMAYQDLYGNKGQGTLILLQDNYRSREEVIADINGLFSHLMSAELGDVAYDQSQALGYGNLAYASSAGEEHHSEILTYAKRVDLSNPECEARLIAKDIQEKLASHYQVKDFADGALKPTRDCEPGDFAILIARKRDFPIYEKIFSLDKIPLKVSDDADLSSLEVSQVFLSFLRLIEVLDQDEMAERHCYASIMRSYLYEENDADLYQELISKSYRDSSLFKEIRARQKELKHALASQVVSYLFDKFPFFEKLPSLGDVKANYERLNSFLTSAELSDRLGDGYEGFLAHFADLKKYDESFSLTMGSDEGNSVHLMSIHASKGLQFPIVYFPDLDAKVNTSDSSDAFMVNQAYGLMLPLTMEEGNPLNVLHYLTRNDEGLEAISERIRLFYVALTRAEEKIILVEKEEAGVEYSRLDETNILKLSHKKDAEGQDSVKAILKSPNTFREFIALSGAQFKTSHREVVDPLQTSPSFQNTLAYPLPSFQTLEIKPVELLNERASKLTDEKVDEEALAYGTRLHRYLELADFLTKDVSYIEEPHERELIARVLSLSLFRNVAQAQIYHEYGFYEKETGVRGSIDLLLVYADKEVIVDYKARSIDDEAYRKQLGLYRAYVERVFKKKSETYLLSIIAATVLKVE